MKYNTALLGESAKRSFCRPLGGPTFFAALAVAVTVFLVFIPTLDSDFVYDSRSQILIDDFIHDPANLPAVLSFRVLAMDVLDHNRPVILASLMLDSLIWDKQPFGYHLASVLLHAVNAALLFLFTLHLLRRTAIADRPDQKYAALGAAAFGALLFALHPLVVEAVLVVSFREDVLVLFFMLAGLLAASAFRESPRRLALLSGTAVCAACLLAAGSKETGAGAPVLIAAYGFLFRRGDRASGRAWIGLTVIAGAVTLLFLAARFMLEPAESVIFVHPPRYPAGSFVATVFQLQPRIFAFYLRQMLWPRYLCADYGGYSIRNFGLILSYAIIAVAAFFWLAAAWKNRIAAFALVFFGVGILPVSNLIPLYIAAADRYLYLPLAAIAVLATLGAGRLVRKVRWPIHIVVSTVPGLTILAVLATLSVQRQQAMGCNISLWQDTLAGNPASTTAANNLGFALYMDGKTAEALSAWQYAVKLRREPLPDTLAGLALGLYAADDISGARQALRQAIGKDPRYVHPEQLVQALTWERELADHLGHVLQELDIAGDR